MSDIICQKCKSVMIKRGTMDSGNSKFDIFKCTNCNNEKMMCRGIN